MEWPFPVEAKLAAAVKNITLTTDSNVFERETSKIVTLGRIKPKKVWVMCDGKGGMHACYLEHPAKQIETLVKLRDKGKITKEDFERVKDKLLDQFSPDHLPSG